MINTGVLKQRSQSSLVNSSSFIKGLEIKDKVTLYLNRFPLTPELKRKLRQAGVFRSPFDSATFSHKHTHAYTHKGHQEKKKRIKRYSTSLHNLVQKIQGEGLFSNSFYKASIIPKDKLKKKKKKYKITIDQYPS